MEPRVDKCVLVIEDDEVLRSAMKMVLEWEGYHVLCAENGREALDLLRIGKSMGKAPGLILLDLMMPVLDGWQLCDELQQDPALAAIPVVVVSALPAADTPGVAAHIQKPFEVQQVLEAIRDLHPAPGA
jgi:CheY-like chemotaxis protein